MAEQFCLRWNNHQSTLVSVFENLLESETLTDCTLAAEGRYLKAHKVVLSACSPYFETILCQHYDKHPIVVLKDVKYYEMRAMLDYMYRGEVNISQDQLDAFIKTAESLQIKGLTDQGGGGGTSCDSDERDVGSTKRKGSPFKSDIAPESPLVGNTPLREGSTSPSSLKRRRRQRHTSQGNGEVPDSHVDTSNSCDIPPQMLGTAPPVPNKSVTAAATSSSSHPLQSSTPELGRLPVKKTEPPDIIQPKIEMDDHSDDVEDLTLDDDEDYGGESDLSKPGTSYSGPAGQDYSQWQMTGERSTDEVFMAAQEAINNQSNSQDGRRFRCKCGKTFKYRTHYSTHIHWECGKGPSFQCNQCPYVCHVKHVMRRHIINVHRQTIENNSLQSLYRIKKPSFNENVIYSENFNKMYN